MKDLFQVFTVDKALESLFKSLSSLQGNKEKLSITKALGRVLAEDVFSPLNIPGFVRSTMDGYAVRAKDTFGASEGMPAYLNIVGEVLMGQPATQTLGHLETVKVATGGMLPENSDGVVMVEYTENLDEKTIGIVKAIAPGENIVLPDEDVKKGELVLKAGSLLRPQDLGVLSGMGVMEVEVYSKPKVGIVSTGDEVVAPDQEPGLGQVKDINSYTLYGLIIERGGEPTLYGIIPDQFETLRQVLERAIVEQDMVVITGGSSVGTRDVTAKVIDDLGEPGVIVHGVSVKPGKPTILGVVKNKPIIGLPGHPVSAMVIFDLFGTPVINQLQGSTSEYNPKTVKARLTRSLSSATGREDHIRVKLIDRDGERWAEPVLGKSGLIFTMVKAQGIFKIPLDKEGISAGEWVEVFLF